MPRIINYTPSWLSRPSPGFEFFQAHTHKGKLANGSRSSQPLVGPQRTIARRGTEIFAVVGNELRWSDLVLLKEKGLSQSDLKRSQAGGRRHTSSNGTLPTESSEEAEGAWRVLKTTVSGQITQLIISPQEDYLAIVTPHTVHIAVLPDSAHLASEDTGPLKLRTFQLGPTAHVLEQSPLASILWHPLGHLGRCLVTVTTDAVVRLWEVNREDRWSFDKPTLAFDMKKLANATSAEEDLRASAYGASKGFSPDSVEMEVAAVCFAGSGSEGEHPWAPMTLWVAMTEGDIYALCPLLPNKWQPSPGQISALAASVAAKTAVAASGSGSAEDRLSAKYQEQWLADIAGQEPQIATGSTMFENVEFYSRPARPGPVPKLQGPFQIEPETDEDIEITDIHVVGLQTAGVAIDLADGFHVPEDNDEAVEGIPAAVICLANTDGKVHICLDFDGVEARWLPSGKGRKLFHTDDYLPSLLLFEVVDLQRCMLNGSSNATRTGTLMFSQDPNSRDSLFVTHETGVSYLSLSSWINRLQDELSDPSDAGSAFRVDLFLEGAKTLVEHPVELRQQLMQPPGHDPSVTVAVALKDSDLGYFLLTVSNRQPYAATFDLPEDALLPDSQAGPNAPLESEMAAVTLREPRIPYQPPQALWTPSELPGFLEKHSQRHKQRGLKDEVKLSDATLGLLTEAHKILSQETHQLGLAAADLFRRCERLQDEFRDQIARVSDIAVRIDAVTGEDDEDELDDEESVIGNAKIERRLEGVKARQQDLVARHERIRKRLARAGGRESSEKEKAWVGEVEKLKTSALGPDEGDGEVRGEADGVPAAWRRFEEVKRLEKELVAQAEEASNAQGREEGDADGAIRVSSEFRRAKVAEVMRLLERESALVEVAMEKLQRLSARAL